MPVCGLNIIERRSFMSESAIHRIGKYEILGKLGDGATSVVYLAKDEFNDRQVGGCPEFCVNGFKVNAVSPVLRTG